MKTNFSRSLYILLTLLLAACGPLAPTPTVTPSSTTSVPSRTPTLPPTETPTPEPTPLPVDGLRMAYVMKGNLYLQDGDAAPIPLTNSGLDSLPLISDDGMKISFNREKDVQILYTINADGSNEQELVTNDMLLTLGPDYDELTRVCHNVFVPHTHLLLFNTCYHPDKFTTVHNGDLFITDTDTGKTKNLRPSGQAGGYYVSPDGRMIAIDMGGRIDIVDLDGRVIYKNLANYPVSEPISLATNIYWTFDSKELILLLPLDTVYDTSRYPTYAIWHYQIDSGEGIQITLDPLPMNYADYLMVSPDGNWLLYYNDDHHADYLGNLRDGSVQALSTEPGIFRYAWSPDSKRYIYGIYQPDGSALYLASLDAAPVFLSKGDFIGWIDAERYLYFVKNTVLIGTINGETRQILADANEGFVDGIGFTYVLMEH